MRLFDYMIAQKTVEGPETAEISREFQACIQCGDRIVRSTAVKKDTDAKFPVPIPATDCNAKLYAAVQFIATILFFFVPNPCSAAETIRLAQGLWEIRTSTRLPELSQSVSRQYTECIGISDLDPSSFFENTRHCTISGKTLSGNAVNWLLDCTVPGRGKLHGRGSFASTGARAEGSTTLWVLHQGREVEMIAKWSGHRIGECQ